MSSIAERSRLEILPVLDDPAYDELHSKVEEAQKHSAELRGNGLVSKEKTPLERSAENIRLVFKNSVSHMGDYFPSGIHFPEIIWLETGRTYAEPEEDETYRFLHQAAHERKKEEDSQDHLDQLVVAVDKSGSIKMLQATSERNEHGELFLDAAKSREAADEEVIKWSLPLMEIVKVRLENARTKSIWEDKDRISKGEMAKVDSHDTRRLTEHLINIGQAKDLLILERMRLNGYSNKLANTTGE